MSIFGGRGGGGGGWLAQSHIFYDGTAGCVTHCHKGVERGKILAKTASHNL